MDDWYYEVRNRAGHAAELSAELGGSGGKFGYPLAIWLYSCDAVKNKPDAIFT